MAIYIAGLAMISALKKYRAYLQLNQQARISMYIQQHTLVDFMN